MGLAASQARFLGLTARKSNTEYEGQQVNQQRTALANESASLFSQLSNLTVPTPPDITNYYKTEYTFSYGADTFTMTSLPKRDEDGTYSVNLSHVITEPAYKTYNDTSLETLGFDYNSVTKTTIDFSKVGTALEKHITNEGGKVDNTSEITQFSYNNNWYYEVGGKVYQYTPNQVVKEQPYTGVKLKMDESGNFSTIQHPEFADGKEITISTTTVKDDDAYELAMSQYKKEDSEYNKTIAEINAKTEVLQQQDKTLELRLNQLDTEQNAISTEMDAVQKVIEKNVESTFKTFA